MLISKVNSVLSGVISIFNARYRLRCAECSPRFRYCDLTRRDHCLSMHARAAHVLAVRERKVRRTKTDTGHAAFVPLGLRNDWEHSVRFVGSYATGPVGSCALRVSTCACHQTRACSQTRSVHEHEPRFGFNSR